ncbi:DUF2585 family protein [Paracoccus luteus]|uniref:DUF2585 family protein n=1 Tax=Paracoccus luteus TaxID=2508543 RepID=UPI00106F44DF|nr:DUF2585 family protein [Paracoccus luteus]
MSGPPARTEAHPLHDADAIQRTGLFGRSPMPVPAAWPALQVAMAILLVNGAVILWLLLLGRGVLPDTVPLQWWSGSTLAADNSQHIADFYSALHAVSGAALCFAARAVCPDWPLHRRFIMVIACSGVWEVVENAPAVISLFNGPGSPDVYRGDSIVNALSDTAFVAFGFLGAHSLPRWFVIAAGASAEITAALIVHDGFVLGTVKVVLR